MQWYTYYVCLGVNYWIYTSYSLILLLALEVRSALLLECNESFQSVLSLEQRLVRRPLEVQTCFQCEVV